MTQYIVTGRNQGVPRPPYVDLIPDAPGQVFTASLSSDAEASLIAGGFIAKYPLPQPVFLTPDASDNTVPTSTGDGSYDWEAGGGGGGVTVPLALDAASGPIFSASVTGDTTPRVSVSSDGGLVWSDGTDPDVELVHDLNNYGGPGNIGVYPIGGDFAEINIYDNNLAPDGTETPDTSPRILALSPNQVYIQGWESGGQARLEVNPIGSGNPTRGFLFLSRDSDFDATTTEAINVVGGLGIYYDGKIQWGGGDTSLGRSGAGVLEIAQAGGGLKLTSPDGLTTKTLTIDNSGALALV